MASEIFVKRYDNFPYNEKEIMRYALCQGADENSDMYRLMRECTAILDKQAKLSFGICYRFVPIVELCENGDIDCEIIKLKSRDLYKCLKGCKSAVLMAATIGHDIDRLIMRYNRVDPAKALFMQAIGAERVETMLDSFCDDFALVAADADSSYQVVNGITPRFSPGYGDLDLGIQPQFLEVIDANRKIGISLNSSLLMAPSKSVTAIAGIRP